MLLHSRPALTTAIEAVSPFNTVLHFSNFLLEHCEICVSLRMWKSEKLKKEKVMIFLHWNVLIFIQHEQEWAALFRHGKTFNCQNLLPFLSNDKHIFTDNLSFFIGAPTGQYQKELLSCSFMCLVNLKLRCSSKGLTWYHQQANGQRFRHHW